MGFLLASIFGSRGRLEDRPVASGLLNGVHRPRALNNFGAGARLANDFACRAPACRFDIRIFVAAASRFLCAILSCHRHIIICHLLRSDQILLHRKPGGSPRRACWTLRSCRP